MEQATKPHPTPIEGLGSILAAARVSPLRRALAVAALRPEISDKHLHANGLAHLLGYTRNHLVEALAGRRSDSLVMPRLANLLGVSVADLRGEAPPLVEASAAGDMVARVS